jgi:hypothetical protein
MFVKWISFNVPRFDTKMQFAIDKLLVLGLAAGILMNISSFTFGYNT